jgi:hypothetical protein
VTDDEQDGLDPIVVAGSRVEDLTVSEAARSPTGAHLLPDRTCRGHRDRDDHELGEFG